MKLFPALTLVAICLYSCQTKTNTLKNNDSILIDNLEDTVQSSQKIASASSRDSTRADLLSKQFLVLISNGIQIVNEQNGSSREISFGIDLNQMIEIVSKVLEMKPRSLGINQECGAGPLQMASWNNGLTLVFQQKNSQINWQFAGWYMGDSPGSAIKLTTMAGIGIGSSRAEMESAYVVEVNKTTLGHEFSTSSGLYGIFDGSGKDANITSLWSGVSCNFR